MPPIYAFDRSHIKMTNKANPRPVDSHMDKKRFKACAQSWIQSGRQKQGYNEL